MFLLLLLFQLLFFVLCCFRLAPFESAAVGCTHEQGRDSDGPKSTSVEAKFALVKRAV